MKNGITCPECDGKGFSVGMGCPGWKLIEIKCAFCRETGKVTSFDLLRKKEGERMRQNRLDRNQSLREEAARLGIKPSELSDRERGILRLVK